jgi:hypothetical protein
MVGRGWVGEKERDEEESDHSERDGLSQIWIDQISIELSVYSSATGLQCASKDDKRDNPGCVHF